VNPGHQRLFCFKQFIDEFMVHDIIFGIVI